jgi:hypothetical protein
MAVSVCSASSERRIKRLLATSIELTAVDRMAVTAHRLHGSQPRVQRKLHVRSPGRSETKRACIDEIFLAQIVTVANRQHHECA